MAAFNSLALALGGVIDSNDCNCPLKKLLSRSINSTNCALAPVASTKLSPSFNINALSSSAAERDRDRDRSSSGDRDRSLAAAAGERVTTAASMPPISRSPRDVSSGEFSSPLSSR
jgi:hypothetical protein